MIDPRVRRDGASGKVVFLVPGGGFQWEALSLLGQLGPVCDYVFVMAYGAVLPKELAGKQVVRVQEISSRAAGSPLRAAVNCVRCFVQSWRMMRRQRPSAAVCMGSSISVPIVLAARLSGVPSYFVESITRSDSLSRTGTLLLRMKLVTEFYVQWPELAETFPGTSYKGSVL